MSPWFGCGWCDGLCYPPKIIGILVSMIVTGAARSVGVKIIYQMGFVNPLFVTLLYLLGHALALLVYGGSLYVEQRRQRQVHRSCCHDDDVDDGDDLHYYHHSRHTLNSMISKSIHRTSLHDHAIVVAQLAGLQHHPPDHHSNSVLATAATLSDHDKDDDEVRPIMVSFWGMLPVGELWSPYSSSGGGGGQLASTPNGNHIEMMLDPGQLRRYNNHGKGRHGSSGSSTTTMTTTLGGGGGAGVGRGRSVTTFSASNNNSHNNDDTQATQWGSVAGLNEQSKRAVQWIHTIPWYGKPIIPGLCNLGKSALRWASLVYIDASVAEILIGGLELVLSVVAARLVRRRLVAHVRWLGVAVVTLGIVWVGLADTILTKTTTTMVPTNQPTAGADGTVSSSQNNNNSSSSNSHQDTLTGLMLILAQSIMSAVQDIAEEIFMAESDFPATLLLGMEGLLGFVIGTILYVPMAPLFQEDARAAWRQFTATPVVTLYGMGLVLLFLVNGIANILTTSATSSMTRNVWKNIRTVLVWVLGLSTYYVVVASTNSGDHDNNSSIIIIGEPWETPKSFLTLLGFFIMLVGIHTYYRPVPHQPAVLHSSQCGDDDDDDKMIQRQQRSDEESAVTTGCRWEPSPALPPPVVPNILTIGSMTTALHDNTIRQRSSLPSRPRSMTILSQQSDDGSSSNQSIHHQQRALSSSSSPASSSMLSSSSPRFEIHTAGGGNSQCGCLHS